MSSKDIDRGSLWFSEISDQLRNTTIGIVCLTRENKEKPWILFEAGALAKGLTSTRVCTLLVDLEATDVGNPLAQFNHTEPTREGILHLVRTINSSLETGRLKDQILDQVFDTYWPQFESGLQAVLSDTPSLERSPARTEESIMTEILRTVRTMDRRIRQLEAHSDADSSSALPIEPRGFIGKAVAMGMDPAVILEHVTRSGYSSELASRFIREALRRERRVAAKIALDRAASDEVVNDSSVED